jgi:formate hydrogenlyase subunit 6/NADH:ubiquinone oxidoreductase subunit I
MYGVGILKGLWVTLKHIAGTYVKDVKKFPRRYAPGGVLERTEYDLYGIFTCQYPEERYEMFPRFRGALMQLRDAETGEPNCTACSLCERACPHGVISMEVEGKGKERVLKSYTYDVGRCVFCRLCVESCRFDAIEMSHEYELSRYSNEFVLDMDDLLALGDKYGVHKTGEAWGVNE